MRKTRMVAKLTSWKQLSEAVHEDTGILIPPERFAALESGEEESGTAVLYALSLFYRYPLEVLLGLERFPQSGRLGIKPRPEELAGDVDDRQN